MLDSNDNRRKFLLETVRSGAAALGGAIIGAAAVKSSPVNAALPEKRLTSGIPPLPWPYTVLDPEEVRKLGHKLYFEKECCAGVFAAITGSLAEVTGAPFDTIPVDMMRYGAGGAAGFASLCGALNGAGAAMGLVCDEDAAKTLLTELMSWYAAAPLPTEASQSCAREKAWLPGDPSKISDELPQSIAGGNLCHMSVSNWCGASGKTSGSKERKERCARITGDVAAQAAQLLNSWHQGWFKTRHPLPAEKTGCRECHQKSKTSFTRTRMDCTPCHIRPVMKPDDEKHRYPPPNPGDSIISGAT
jgi:hypothetical protein